MRKNSDESITIVIILLIVCFVLVSGVISYGIYTCTGGSWKFGDWKFDTCFKSPDNTPSPAPAPAPSSDDNYNSAAKKIDDYNRANNPLDFFTIPEVPGTPHRPELYDMAKKGKCHPTYIDTFRNWFHDSIETGDIIGDEQQKAMENGYKIGNIGKDWWSTSSTNTNRVIGDTETFKVEYETDDPTLIQTEYTQGPGDWEFEYVKTHTVGAATYTEMSRRDSVVFRSKKGIRFRYNNMNNLFHLYFNPWTSHFTLGDERGEMYPEHMDPHVFSYRVQGDRNYRWQRRNKSNMKVTEDGYILYNIHGDIDDVNLDTTPADKIKAFKFKVSLKEGQTITKSDVDVLHNFHNTLKNVCSQYDNTGDGIGGEGARPIGLDWGHGGESECKKVTKDHPDLAGIPFSEKASMASQEFDKYSPKTDLNIGFEPDKIWNPFVGKTDLCRFEPVGKCFPLDYTGGGTDGKGSYSYNPNDQIKSFSLEDHEYLSGANVNGEVDNKISIDTQKVCTSIDNKRECDTRKVFQASWQGALDQKGENICRWWSGFKAFVKPTVRWDDGLEQCIEGDEYWNMKGQCTVDSSYTSSETSNVCPDGIVTRKVCGYADNLPGGAKKCNFQVQTGYARKPGAETGSDKQGDYIHCGTCKPKSLYSRGGGKKNYDNVDEIERSGSKNTKVYGIGNELNPYTQKDCKDLLISASTSNDSFFTIGVDSGNKIKAFKQTSVSQNYKDLVSSGKAEDIKTLNEAGYFLGCKWDGDKDADTICEEFTDNIGECEAHKHVSYRDAQEGACHFQSVKHCDGKWEYPDEELNYDNEEVPNTCGARFPGLRKMTYREINTAKAGGNPCKEELVGWVEHPYPDDEEFSNSESIHFRTTVPVSPSNISVGLNGPLEYGHASLRNPRTNDWKYVPCDVACVEEETYKKCEFKGDTAEARLEAAADATKRINYCEGQVVKYFGIKKPSQGNNGKKCPHFSINESKAGQILNKEGETLFERHEKTNQSCTVPINRDGGWTTLRCSESNCQANLEKIKEIQKNINEGDYAIEFDDNGVKTVYDKNNKITIQDLYAMYDSQCMTIGMTRNNTNEERKLACTDVQQYCSTCGDGKVFLKDERVCRTYDDDCGDSSDGFMQVGVKIRTPHGYTANHNPPDFCKWVDAPETDIHSTETAYNNSIETSS